MPPKAPIPLPRKLFNPKCNESGANNNEVIKNEVVLIKDDNPDMSLSTLINSVEKDIELLEQLEMKSDDDRCSLYLPVSAKLLSLPGYRPRECTASPPPLPRDGTASPPPLPRKTIIHRRHNSDSTLNSSYETEPDEDVPSTPSSPTDSHMADQVTKYMLRKPVTVFCPFCLGQFFHHEYLHDHLLHYHPEELYQLKDKKYQNLKPETCPCCQAEFLKPGLGQRHLVSCHPKFFCSLMLGNITQQTPKLTLSLFQTATHSPERHSFCLHCGQRFLTNNVKLLALHLQQQHPVKVSQALQGLFIGEKSEIKKQNLTPNPLDVPVSNYLTPNLYNYIPGRPEAYLQLLDSPFHIYESVDTPKQVQASVKGKIILKNNKLYDKIKVNDFNDLTQNKSCRQENQYGPFPHTPKRTKHSKCFRRPVPLPLSGLDTYHGLPQPEPPTSPITGMGSESYLAEDDNISLAREKEDSYHYTYNRANALFRCNLCGDKFTDNNHLLLHLKTNHMAVTKALKAQFSCAKCPAKFFKNAFLLKHILTHFP